MADAPKGIKLSECERLIKQIRDVISVKIVLGEQQDIEEIHVLAEDTRSAKQLVRDIETLFRLECGIDLDHKKVSIVQLNNRQRFGHQRKRIKFTAIRFSLSGSELEAMVELSSGEKSCEGKSSGPNSRGNRLKLVAEATLDAMREYLDEGSSVMLEDVVQVPISRGNMILITLAYIEGQTEECLVGTALVKQDKKEAIVRATLSALNRRIAADI